MNGRESPSLVRAGVMIGSAICVPVVTAGHHADNGNADDKKYYRRNGGVEERIN